jgi:outer membrane protein TolC
LRQQQSEIDKLEKLIATDKEIIDLRIKVKDAARAQLENGVITANDYLREVNAEDQARQSEITHRVQLLQAQINYQTILGKTPSH